MSRTLKNYLSDIYAGLLSSEVLGLPIKESLATCDNCYKALKTSPKPHYSAELKCCTYYPFLPNYHVGAILAHDGKGADVVRRLILDRSYALPVGVCPPPQYQNKFNNKLAEDYGNREDLLCPFYMRQGGLCSIWRFRGHECVSFYCVSSYGERGEIFWRELREELFKIEMELSQLSMIQKGYTPREIESQLEFIKLPPDKQIQKMTLDQSEWSKIWLHHHDNIENYYKECYNFVKSLTSNDIETGRINKQLFKNILVGGPL